MKLRLATLALGGVLLGAGSGKASDPVEPARLYFFFSPESPDAPALARKATELQRELRLKNIPLRPVLLLQDFRSLSRVTRYPSFVKTLQVLQGPKRGGLDIPLFDPEGLKMAKAWGLTILPAIVLVRNGKAHVLEGSHSDPHSVRNCHR